MLSANLTSVVSNVHPVAGSLPLPKMDDVSSHSKQQRKTSVKICQFPGCEKGARGASRHCISHGGGRRCQRPGCPKFCKAHGGGRRCEHLGCTKSAEGSTNLCIAHGGGKRCGFHGGCNQAARGKSGLCIHHGGGKRCKIEACTRVLRGLLVSGLLMEVVAVANSLNVVRVLREVLNFVRLMLEEKGAPFQAAPSELREALLSVKDMEVESDVLSMEAMVCAPRVSMEVPCIVFRMVVVKDVLSLVALRAREDEQTFVSVMVEGKDANRKGVKRAFREVLISARHMVVGKRCLWGQQD